MEKEQLLRSRLEELADLAYQRDIVTFSDFLDLQEQHIVHSINWRAHGVTCRLSGGYDLAERQMAAFLPDAFYMYMDEESIRSTYPVSYTHLTLPTIA